LRRSTVAGDPPFNTEDGSNHMTSNQILQLNALSTAASAVGMLVFRSSLYRLFGADSPVLFDVIAIGLLLYAGALVFVARTPLVGRRALMAFTFADGLWVAGSVLVLLLFWNELTPLARVLVIAAAVVVDVFAMLQFRSGANLKSPIANR
jgi:hypothetical protein